MGVCCPTGVAAAQLVLQDGELKEFSNPVRVSDILEENPTCFVCNLDDMDFDKVFSAMNEAEELQLGLLYFALPLNCLDSPLRAEEMASLVIRASLGIKMNGGREKCFRNCLSCGIKRIKGHQMIFNRSCKREAECSETLVKVGGDSPGGGSGDSFFGSGDIGFVPKKKTEKMCKERKIYGNIECHSGGVRVK